MITFSIYSQTYKVMSSFFNTLHKYGAYLSSAGAQGTSPSLAVCLKFSCHPHQYLHNYYNTLSEFQEGAELLQQEYDGKSTLVHTFVMVVIHLLLFPLMQASERKDTNCHFNVQSSHIFGVVF